MNSFTYLFVTLSLCYSLTLNEKAILRDSPLATSGTRFVTHSQQVSVRKLREETLNVADALAQLRAEIDKAGFTRDSGDMSHLLENSTHHEAEAIKSLIFSSAPLMKSENQKTKKSKLSSAQPGSFHAAWAQSGGGCHSALSQFGMVMGYQYAVNALVKKFLQGERLTKASLRGTSVPKMHTTSSGGTWMWVSLIGWYSQESAGVQSLFSRRNGVGWIDAIVVPNENPQQWGKILQNSLTGNESSTFQRKEDAGMQKYQTMIKKALHFYVSVREDLSLRNLDMQEVVEAELAAEVSKADPEVQAIAAQYDITPNSHPLLLKAIKKSSRADHSIIPYWNTLDQSDFHDCDIMEAAEFTQCSEGIRDWLFGPMKTCVRKDISPPETGFPWTWNYVGYKKFLKPWFLSPGSPIPQNVTFEELSSPAYGESWDIYTTGVSTVHADDRFPAPESVQKEVDGLLPKPVVEVLGASGNWGLSAFYLLYYTTVVLGCVPSAVGFLDWANEKNLSTKIVQKYNKFLADIPVNAANIANIAFSSALDISDQPLADFRKQIYYFPVPPLDEMVYMDGASSDNNGLGPILWMIGEAGICVDGSIVQASEHAQLCDTNDVFTNEVWDIAEAGSPPDWRWVAQVTPTILVTSTGDDDYDFGSVSAYFTPEVQQRYAPPAINVLIPFDVLCSDGHNMVPNTRYLLGPSQVTYGCMGAGPCTNSAQVWSKPGSGSCDGHSATAWTKLNQTGILFLPRIQVFNEHGIGEYMLRALTIAMSIKSELSKEWLFMFPHTTAQEASEDHAWPFYRDVEGTIVDPEMENFPTFPASSLMNVPVKYAFALMQYMSHIAYVQMTCLGEQAPALLGFAQTNPYLVNCEELRCQEAIEASDWMIFPVISM